MVTLQGYGISLTVSNFLCTSMHFLIIPLIAFKAQLLKHYRPIETCT